jgi:hypothetical protein
VIRNVPGQSFRIQIKENIAMKAKVWVLCTVLTDENAPAMPAVFADEAEARAAYDKALRAEWDSCMDWSDDPYPGDPDEAQDRMRQAHGAEWGRWELTCHAVEIETSAAP